MAGPCFCCSKGSGFNTWASALCRFRWMFVYYITCLHQSSYNFQKSFVALFMFAVGSFITFYYTCLLNEQQELGQTKTKIMKLIFTRSNLATSVILLLLILLMLKINPPLELGENLPSFSGKVACRLNWWISFRFQNSPPQSRQSVRNNSPNKTPGFGIKTQIYKNTVWPSS